MIKNGINGRKNEVEDDKTEMTVTMFEKSALKDRKHNSYS